VGRAARGRPPARAGPRRTGRRGRRRPPPARPCRSSRCSPPARRGTPAPAGRWTPP
jgi:hypothetical protein